MQRWKANHAIYRRTDGRKDGIQTTVGMYECCQVYTYKFLTFLGRRNIVEILLLLIFLKEQNLHKNRWLLKSGAHRFFLRFVRYHKTDEWTANEWVKKLLYIYLYLWLDLITIQDTETKRSNAAKCQTVIIIVSFKSKTKDLHTIDLKLI